MSYKRIKLDPDHYEMLTGKDKHEIDLIPGVLDIWFQWYADRDVMVSLLFADGKKIPYANGLRGSFNVQSLNVLSILIECTKTTTVCVAGSYRDMAVKEKLDPTKLTITPPAPAMLRLQDMVRREVARLTGGDEEIEVNDEDNLEDDLEDDEGFGTGYMEDEEPTPRKRPPKPSEKPGQGGTANRGGDEPVRDSGVSDVPKAAEA